MYASKCWAPSVNDLPLECNDRAMVWWICNVRLKDCISSDSFLEKLGINNIQSLLRYNRLRWFGHVARNDVFVNKITALEVDVDEVDLGRQRDRINDDHKNWKLTRVVLQTELIGERNSEQTWEPCDPL